MASRRALFFVALTDVALSPHVTAFLVFRDRVLEADGRDASARDTERDMR